MGKSLRVMNMQASGKALKVVNTQVLGSPFSLCLCKLLQQKVNLFVSPHYDTSLNISSQPLHMLFFARYCDL